jgi:hypothetical protein
MIPNLATNVAADEDPGQPTPIFQAAATPSTGFLSPTSPMGGHSRNASLEAPYSPSSTEYDGSSIPPSPTLSNRLSVHFQTSLAPRENKADSSPRSEASSLGLHNPMVGRPLASRQMDSLTTGIVSSDEEPRGDSISHVDKARFGPPEPIIRCRSDSSDTATAVSVRTGKGKRKDSTNGKKGERIELEQDGDVNPAPFAFRPCQLAYMLDPKSLGTLTETLLSRCFNCDIADSTNLRNSFLDSDKVLCKCDPYDRTYSRPRPLSQSHPPTLQSTSSAGDSDADAPVPTLAITEIPNPQDTGASLKSLMDQRLLSHSPR